MILSADNAVYYPPVPTGFWAFNNTYGKGNLRNGHDFRETIAIAPATFPRATAMSWSWPENVNQGVLAYPEIGYGHSPYMGFGVPVPPAPVDVASLGKKLVGINGLVANYDFAISGETSNFNVAWDLWLTSAPNGDRSTILCEVMIWVHPGWYQFGTGDFPFSSPTISGELNLAPAVAGGRQINLVSLVSHDKLSGPLDVLDILRRMIPMSNGMMTDQMYLSGLEIGCELARGKGALTVNSLSYDVA